MYENAFPRRPRQSPSPFNLFTGGKSAELAIFFNTALSNVNKLIYQLEIKNVSIEQASSATFIALRNSLWKGYKENRNSAGYALQPNDKSLILDLYKKLNKLRNFHSHVWHDHEVNRFDQVLYEFIKECLEIACAAAREHYPHEVDFFYEQLEKFPHFKSHNGAQYITKEGKVFFLSLFLTRGEMSRLLQQLKGSKRTDMPQFKIKHIVYKHFCHRDGSALLQFHQEETSFQQMPIEIRKNILSARQAYKIISYLNDIPNDIYDADSLPLLLKTDTTALVKAETVQQLLEFIKQQQFFQDWLFSEIDQHKQEKGELDTIKKTGMVEVQVKKDCRYHFHISRNILHRLLVERITNGIGFEEKATQQLTGFIKNRLKLFEFFAAQINEDNTFQVELTKEAIRQHRLQGNILLQNHLAKWLDLYEKDDESVFRLGIALANKIRPSGHPGFASIADRKLKNSLIPDPQPIVPHWNDFFIGETQKPRKDNHFVKFAVRYLIDQHVVPSWYWQVETFRIEEKEGKDVLQKKKFFSLNHVPDDHQLTLINGHVLIGIHKNGQTPLISSNRDDFYQLLIGPKTLRYLLCYHIMSNDGPPGPRKPLGSFSGAIMKDYHRILAAIQNGGVNNFEDIRCSLLEPQHVPQLFHKKLIPVQLLVPGITEEHKKNLSDKLKGRIDSIIEKLNNKLRFHYRLTRNEKNRIIMQCYTLFTWSPKFLRKNEYNEMSICHYTIEEPSKFNYLFNTRFQLSRRVPKEVMLLLKQSYSLDELLQNTVRSVIDLLSITKGQAINGILKKEHLNTWYRKLGLSLPDELVTLGEQDQLNANRDKNLSLLPFDVHPSLVLKHFYREAYDSKKFKNGSPLVDIRGERYTQGLYTGHYPTTSLQQFYNQFKEGNGEDKQITIISSKITHKTATTLAEDAMLWYIAKAYLQSNNITDNIGTVIIKTLATESEYHVGNLHEEVISFPLGDPMYIKSNEAHFRLLGQRDKMRILSAILYMEQEFKTVSSLDAPIDITELLPIVDRKFCVTLGSLSTQLHGADVIEIQPLFTKLRLHQLDDYLFRINRSQLRYAAMHYFNRITDEHIDAEPVEGFSLDTAIPFDLLAREIALVYHQGQLLCNKLLEWEHNIINDYCAVALADPNPEAKQTLLKNCCGSLENSKDNYHIKFPTICQWAAEKFRENGVREDELREIRNCILHSFIPVMGSYNFQVLPGTPIGRLLGLTTALFVRRDRGAYLKKANESGEKDETV